MLVTPWKMFKTATVSSIVKWGKIIKYYNNKVARDLEETKNHLY